MTSKSFFIGLLAVFLSGCAGVKKDEPLPKGYSLASSNNSMDTYFVKPDSWFYKGNKNVRQLEVVKALKKEDEVEGHKFIAIKTKYVFDCENKNKYTKIPSGFFDNKYAIGKPVVPFPFSSSRWLFAKDGSSEGVMWDVLCVQLMAEVDAKS